MGRGVVFLSPSPWRTWEDYKFQESLHFQTDGLKQQIRITSVMGEENSLHYKSAATFFLVTGLGVGGEGAKNSPSTHAPFFLPPKSPHSKGAFEQTVAGDNGSTWLCAHYFRKEHRIWWQRLPSLPPPISNSPLSPSSAPSLPLPPLKDVTVDVTKDVTV